MKKAVSIVKISFISILALLLVLILIPTVSRLFGVQNPKIFGFMMANVSSGSMEPTFYKGDSIITHEQDDYEVGDIILFVGADGWNVTHRIVEENADGTYTTKGDNNNSNDTNPVQKSQIEGKVVAILPGMGFVVSELQGGWGIALIILLIALFELPDIIEWFKKDKTCDGEDDFEWKTPEEVVTCAKKKKAKKLAEQYAKKGE